MSNAPPPYDAGRPPPLFTYLNEDAISVELTCPVCLAPLHDPVIHGDGARGFECGSAFCRTCVAALGGRECPTCRGELKTMHPPQRLITNMLNALPVVCAACHATMERGTFNAHWRERCLVTCESGCGAVTAAADAQAHRDTECPRAIVSICAFCRVDVTRADAASHGMNCVADPQRIVSCVVAAADMIELYIGGERFITARRTLARELGSALASFISMQPRPTAKNQLPPTIFLDRDPTWFATILAFLRRAEDDVSGAAFAARLVEENAEEFDEAGWNDLTHEARFWGLTRLVAALEDARRARAATIATHAALAARAANISPPLPHCTPAPAVGADNNIPLLPPPLLPPDGKPKPASASAYLLSRRDLQNATTRLTDLASNKIRTQPSS